MKKYLALVLILICLFTMSSCANNNDDSNYEEEEGYYAPENRILTLPSFYEYAGKWDIPSVRDINVKGYEGDISIPVYQFDTYEEFQHLVEIVAPGERSSTISKFYGEGRDYINQKASYNYAEREYDREFFENYSLLIGIFEGNVKDDNYYEPSYGYSDNAITVWLNLEESDYSRHVWVYVAVPKNVINNCNSIAFFID